MDPSSTTHHLHDSNDYDAIPFTKEALTRLEEQVKSISVEVEGLEDRVVTLERRKKLLKRHIDLRDFLRMPIAKFPLTVLRKIFMYCLPFGHNPTMSRREAPILLGQVCRNWRRIAFETPELWAAIHIPLFPSRQARYVTFASRKYNTIRLQAISSWLLRSKDLPLSISLVASGPFMMTNSPYVERVAKPYLELLSFFASRWRLIYFTIHGIDWIQYFLSRYRKSDLPLLERLHIDGTKCNVGRLTSTKATKALNGEDSFLRCPNLQWLSLPLVGNLVVEAPIQWYQLTTLNLNGACSCPLFQVMATLTLCSNLRALSTCFDISSTGADLALEQTVTLPNLVNLCVIDHCTSYDSPRFFNHLCTPNIRSILYDRFAPSPWLSHLITRESLSRRLLKAFTSFIHRVQGPVEELSLQYDWLVEDDLFKFLSLLPDLKRLSLRGNGRPVSPNTFSQIDLPLTPLLFHDTIIWSLLTIPDKREITVVTRDLNDARGPNGTDDEREGNDSGDGPPNTPSGITLITDGDGGGEVWQETYNFFCPKLEVLHCTAAVFSGKSTLKFLQSRASACKRFGISRIRAVDISFDNGQPQLPDDLMGEIREFAEEAGISVFLHFLTPGQENSLPPPPFSPHDGVYSVGFRDHDVLWFNSVF